MDVVSPTGPVYQAGTLSGNPLAMHVGFALFFELLKNPNIYSELEEKPTHWKKDLIEYKCTLTKRINRGRGCAVGFQSCWF